MSLSATSTSRLHRQQRLQQFSPCKQRQQHHVPRRRQSRDSGLGSPSATTTETIPFHVPFNTVSPTSPIDRSSISYASHRFVSPSRNDSPGLSSTSLPVSPYGSFPSGDVRSVSSSGTPYANTFLFEGDDMPMDEVMGSLNSTPTKERRMSDINSPANRPPVGPGVFYCDERNVSHLSNQSSSDDASSLGLAAEETGSLGRLANAIRNRWVERPSNLSADEKALWDVVQSVLASTRAELNSKRRQIEQRCQDVTNKYEKLRQKEKKLQKQIQSEDEDKASRIEQEEENDRAFRAIQRVLADVTTERDAAVEKLRNELQTAQKEREGISQEITETKAANEKLNAENQGLKEDIMAFKQNMPSILDTESTIDKTSADTITDTDNIKDLKRLLLLAQNNEKSLKRELDAEKSKLDAAEDQVNKAVEENNDLANNLEQEKEKCSIIQAKNQQLLIELEAIKNQTQNQDIQTFAEDSSEAELALKKELEEKTASLETSKMIIASLENANGSIAFELRGKLKEKDEELGSLQATNAERKRTLDSLATELRELQRRQGDVDTREKLNKELTGRYRSLAKILERNVKDLRSAAVMHEAMGDIHSVDKISSIVSETFTSLKGGLESSEDLLGSLGAESEDNSSHLDGSVSSRSQNDSMKGLKHDLAQKSRAIAKLEDALQRQTEEAKMLKSQMERNMREKDEEANHLHSEIEMLRDQCKTNMEVLAKKGRELEVLRDSLKVEDGVGYISDDDGSDADEEPERDTASSASQITALRYGPSQAEAIATLMSHSGNGIEMGIEIQKVASEDEVNILRAELQKANEEKESKAKQLEAEKESLANAKMIISSLEKANKSMMEDLRARLQDSNTAIASLLEKSMEHEKTSANLRAEVDKVRNERDDGEKRQNAQIAKLQDENLVISMKIEAKDLEIEKLRSSLLRYGANDMSPMSTDAVGSTSVEEKKEEIETG